MWLVNSIFREPWWEPYLPLIIVCGVMFINRRHRKYRKQLARDALLWVLCTRRLSYWLSAWGWNYGLLTSGTYTYAKTVILMSSVWYKEIINGNHIVFPVEYGQHYFRLKFIRGINATKIILPMLTIMQAIACMNYFDFSI